MRAGRIVAGWFGLIVLYTVVTRADSAVGVLGYINGFTRRLSDPSMALIPARGAAEAADQAPAAPKAIAPGTVITSPRQGADV